MIESAPLTVSSVSSVSLASWLSKTPEDALILLLPLFCELLSLSTRLHTVQLL